METMPEECPRCREFYRQGDLYCGACGCQLDNCPRCKESYDSGGFYCGGCGRKFDRVDRIDDTPDTLSKITKVITIFCTVVLIIELLCLVVYSVDIFNYVKDYSVAFLVIVPEPTALFWLSAKYVPAYWLCVVAILVASGAYAIHKFWIALKENSQSKIENTGLFWNSIFLSFTLFFNFVCVFIVLMLGQDVTTPLDNVDKFELMFLVADAAFWEEIVVRVLYIGVPMALISLALSGKVSSLKCIFGGFEMSTIAMVLIMISSAIFGIAHYSGWEQYWKVIATGAMGLCLGYVFVRFGLYASILLHFMTNYLTSFSWFGADWAALIVELALIGAGIAATIFILRKLTNFSEKVNALPKFRNKYSE